MTVRAEVERLKGVSAADSLSGETILAEVMTTEALEEIDLFDRVQLAEVVRVCRKSRTLSEAGRTLFAQSRRRRKSANDADRLRKYLARFGLDWERIARPG